MYFLGTVKHSKYGYFRIQAVTIPPMFISLGCDSGNKPGPGTMETAYITYNHGLTVYTCTNIKLNLFIMLW